MMAGVMLLAAGQSIVDTLADLTVRAGMVAAGITAVVAVAAVAWRILRRLVHLQDVLERVEARSAELEHNGGGSIKDATTRTDERLSRVEAAVDRMGYQVAALARRVDDIGGDGR